MKVWQIYGEGEDFVIDGTPMAFELSGFVEADDPGAEFAQACELARWGASIACAGCRSVSPPRNQSYGIS